jgi:dipeptidyl aminopeptidase/acylaminoacyl peptidase
MKQTLFFLIIIMTTFSFAQKKILDHADFEIWKTIQNERISPKGNLIMYSLEEGEKDHFLKIKNTKSTTVFEYPRGQKGLFTYDSRFALFTIKPWKDSISAMKRRKVKKNKMPKDSLGIYNTNDKSLTKIANVKSYKTPEKWSGYIAYLLEEIKSEKKEKKDTLNTKEKQKVKKVSNENGYHLVLRNLVTKKQDTFRYVTNFSFARKGKRFAFTTTGESNKTNSGVYVLNLENNQLTEVYQTKKAKYYQLNFSETGKNLAFVVDSDTTKIQVRPNELYRWSEGKSQAKKMLDARSSPKGYRVSSDGKILFSKDESKLFFGLAEPPIVKDTTLIEDEIVNVEVWTYNEPRLYTVQELQLKNDKKKSYRTVIHLNNDKLVQIANKDFPNAIIGDEGNANYALISTSHPYRLESQWTGMRARNFAIVNINTGESNTVLTKVSGSVNLSPNGKYVYGYNPVDSTWFTHNIATDKYKELTKGKLFYNELNDAPQHPNSYRSAGWTAQDDAIIVYDRYDIWQFNPENGTGIKLTQGREHKTIYRYVKLDDEERAINSKKNWLLTTFNETSKNSGYYQYNRKSKKGKQLLNGPYSYSTPKMAQQSDKVIFSRQSFQEFPNIRFSDVTFKNPTVISDANPQQKEYNWGTIELINWTSLDGKELTGMLVKPQDFDPNKKYPMIVNFYEKSSNRLNRHWTPSPGRSTINYSFYASRGYLIFNPDVHYRIGYPGESAYNCVIPGVTSLIEKGYVDKDNIGTQGHSWGGYQIAYLVTKTNIFKAAESGAPVPNMISAYGGIRWWTGLSRQFQYEHTQSRIGGTPWEYPARYIENSPIFNIDKINTPLLIMHNDADGHVPWYQGIEFFVSLRRLGKPSWFLNYNDEPHWPLKLQNRKDFNIRMAQFFDYYLKGDLKPRWMQRGVPAIEKGINQGYELIETKKE